VELSLNRVLPEPLVRSANAGCGVIELSTGWLDAPVGDQLEGSPAYRGNTCMWTWKMSWNAALPSARNRLENARRACEEAGRVAPANADYRGALARLGV